MNIFNEKKSLIFITECQSIIQLFIKTTFNQLFEPTNPYLKLYINIAIAVIRYKILEKAAKYLTACNLIICTEKPNTGHC